MNSKKRTQNKKTKSGSRPGQQGNQGKGSKQVKVAPVAFGSTTRQSKPKFVTKNNGLVVSHCEYVKDILGTSSIFAISDTFAINPGLSYSFPWLNQIATRFESYKFRKLNYRFMTERPTTESGFIAMVPDYDPTDPAPASKTIAFQYESATKTQPWESVTMVSTAKNLSKRHEYFTRDGALTGNENLGLYDTGNLFICVGGNSADNVLLGELWCDYEVEFMTPQLDARSQIDSFLVTDSSFNGAFVAPTITPSRNPLLAFDSGSSGFYATEPYSGLICFQVTGTVITAILLTGSAISGSVFTSINASATAAVAYAVCNPSMMNQVLPQCVATTYTAARFSLGEYGPGLTI